MLVDPHRSRASYTALALSLLLACTRSIGDDIADSGGGSAEDGSAEGDSTDGVSAEGASAEGASADEASGGAGDPDAPLWSHTFELDSMVSNVTSMPDGGVALIEIHWDTYEYWLSRRAADGSELWRVELEGAWLDSVTALPDDRLLVGGVRHAIEDSRAIVWRLSTTGEVEVTREHVLSGLGADPTLDGLALGDGGVAYLVNNSSPELDDATLVWADLELAPQWSWNGFPGYVADVAVMPTGEILTLEGLSFEDGTDLLRTFTADGTPTDEQVVPWGSFAADQPLVQIDSSEDDSIRIHGVADTAALDIVLPQDPLVIVPWVTHNHGHVGVAGVADAGRQLTLLQLDASGVELRAVTRPPLHRDYVQPTDVAIAPDGSIYISGFEKAGELPGLAPEYGFLLKLPPP